MFTCFDYNGFLETIKGLQVIFMSNWYLFPLSLKAI